MPDHILDISQDRCRIGIHGPLLVIRRENQPDFRLRMDEIAAICVSEPASTISFRALGSLSSAGVVVVVCDARHTPTGMLMPLANHHAQTPRFALQAKMSEPTRKRLWRQIVRAKVRHQARVLETTTGSDGGLNALIPQVLLGDKTNIEAQAAAAYWQRLMGSQFRRDQEGEGLNAMLNYGYAIVRATVCRAICACGLHPTLGLHHHHRENQFCLADDLMEPFRPLVDLVIWRMTTDGVASDLSPPTKRQLVEEVTGRHRVGGEERMFSDLINRTCRTLVQVILSEKRILSIPRLEFNATAP